MSRFFVDLLKCLLKLRDLIDVVLLGLLCLLLGDYGGIESLDLRQLGQNIVPITWQVANWAFYMHW